ncbi:MAG: hypothetical protein JNK82_23285 [Myxococcaceae bacterium]|nr:hypothetical protein [Myxococcaceae bacterium]
MAADRLDKLEAAVRRLAADVGDQQKTLGSHTETLAQHTETLAQHTETLAQHTETLDEISTSVKQIAKTQVALTNAMTTAIKQLGIDKTLELRVKRLEDAVFGAKH